MSDALSGRSLGLIGGLGVGATIYYYQELVKAHASRGFVPDMVIVHADVNRVLKYAAARDVARMAEYLSELISRLFAAGAQIAAIPAMTPHMCASELVKRSSLPLVDLVEEIAGEIHVRGLKRVALFGTRFTMETRMFGRLEAVEVITPKGDEVDFIHETYLQIVNAGSGAEEQYQGLRRIAHTLCERDRVEAVILAGTELSLLFGEGNTDFPHINGARLHLNAIMRQLFTETGILSGHHDK